MSYSEAKSPFKRTIHTPRKYLNLLKRKRLISMKSIIKLVKIMDVDLSNRVDLGELKAFIRKQDLHHNIPDHLAEAMFWDAACCRKIYVEKNLGEPLTDTEIYSATRVKYMIDPRTKEQIAVPRRFREQWLLLLKSIGEEECRFISDIKAQRIKDQSELKNKTYKPYLYTIQKRRRQSKVLSIKKPKKFYTAPFRPEASMIINNTKGI
jgi:hypothetical protein